MNGIYIGTDIPIEIINSKPTREAIGIIGTGNYGIALGSRLIKHGFKVVFGNQIFFLRILEYSNAESI